MATGSVPSKMSLPAPGASNEVNVEVCANREVAQKNAANVKESFKNNEVGP